MELFRHLFQSQEAVMEHVYPGIYYITGLMFPLQIIIAARLPKSEYIWLSRLRKDLSVDEDIETLVHAYKGKDKNPLYSAAMDLIIRANKDQYEEGIKMCEALRELFEDELMEREQLGIVQGVGKGKATSILEILDELGPVPDDLQDTIMAQTDLSKLSVWLKQAAKATSMEEFIKGIG